jgi:glutamine amidotransferase
MFAIERLGFKAVLSNNPDEKSSRQSDFPGGEASSAMKMLLESGLDSLIPTLKQPVLICLGMQLMQCFGRRGYKRLGYFDIDVIKFTTKSKFPNGLESNL